MNGSSGTIEGIAYANVIMSGITHHIRKEDSCIKYYINESPY